MAIKGFDKAYYLNAKLAQLQADSTTAAEWAGKDAAFLESKLLNGFGLTAEAHYAAYGYQEGLSPNAFFNQAEYIRAKAIDMFNDPATSYTSVAQAEAAFVQLWGGNVYLHYIEYGEKEGINPSNAFDIAGYYEAKLVQLQSDAATAAEWAGKTAADVKQALNDAGLTALEHFIAYGRDEGVVVRPVPADQRVDVDTSVPGQVFSLTAGPDTLVGTNGNDTFNALTVRADGTDATTLSGFDSIDGGAGVDTLNIFTSTADGATGLNAVFPASASVKNVEIVNIFNSGTAAGAFGDASNFQGVQQLWQIGQSVDVTNLEAGSAAGFRNLTLDDSANRSVTAADAAESVTVALDNVKGVATTNVVTLGVSGDSLNAVTVAGKIAQQTVNADAASLALGVTVGEDEQALTLNTAVKTTLTVDDSTSSDKVTSVDASASTGGITYTAANTVASIKTGSGNDDITLSTALTSAVKTATVETGAGDDKVNVNVTSNATGNSVVVNTGAGDDEVTVDNRGTGANAAALNINTGEGDDVIKLNVALTTADRINGGAGNDELQLVGGGALVAQDFALLRSVVSNVEFLTFGAAATNVDGAELAQFSKFTFVAGTNAAANVASKISATQELVATANLTASAAGYVASTDTAAVQGGALNITALETGEVVANGSTVNLTVAPVENGNDETTTLTGDFNSAVVTLNSSFDTNAQGVATGDNIAAVTFTSTDTAGSGKSATSITVSGNGKATIDNSSGNLTTIDASGLSGTSFNGDILVTATAGLTFTGNAAVVETISLGAGQDTINVASTYGQMDTIIGFDAVKETNDAKSTTDILVFSTATLNGLVADQATKVTLSDNVTTLELAFVEAAAASSHSSVDIVFFHFDGNTYLFDNGGTAALEATDLAVKITGLVDFADNWGVFAA